MPIVTREVIYLGNFADADTFEGTASVEDPSIYTNSFGSAGSPIGDNQLNIDFDDANGDGNVRTDNFAPTETISYDLGAGTITTQVDSLAVVSLNVTYQDGSTIFYSNVVMFQDATGNLFLTNSNFAGTDLNTGSRIESINVFSANTSFDGLFQNNLQDFVCFAAGTMISTPLGPRAVETLRTDDLVETLDDGPQPLRWIGSRRLDFTQGADPNHKPIEFKPGSLGDGMPSRSLIVSPQHRIMVRDLEGRERLTPAKALLPAVGVRRMEGRRRVTYFSLMLDSHHILMADGMAAESFYPGPQGMKLLSPMQHLQVLAVCPALLDDPEGGYGEFARPLLRRREAEDLARQGLSAPALQKELVAA